jgi:hypothetical protein
VTTKLTANALHAECKCATHLLAALLLLLPDAHAAVFGRRGKHTRLSWVELHIKHALKVAECLCIATVLEHGAHLTRLV